MSSFAPLPARAPRKTLVDSALEVVAKNGGYKHMTMTALAVCDANEAAFFDLELEAIKAKSYDILRRELKHRLYIPVSFEAGPGAETIAYTQYDQVGVAKLIGNYADDLPLANIKGKKFVQSVEGLGIGFMYSLQDLRASMMANKRLPDRQAKAAMRANGELEETLAAFGSTGMFNGFLNHPNVSSVQATDIGAGERRWIAGDKTADQVNDDIVLMVTAIVDGTSEVEKPNTLLLPTAEFIYASTKRIPNTPETFLSWMLRTNPYIKNVGTWDKLKTADSGSPRAMAYDRSPDKVTLEIPQDFEMLPLQAKGLTFEVPTHSRFGGVIFYYPMSAIYLDDLH